jgi:hypothetical protein
MKQEEGRREGRKEGRGGNDERVENKREGE